MTTQLLEKIAKLPPALLPAVERFVDSLPTPDGKREDKYSMPNWDLPRYDKDGKKIHPKAGCMKGIIVMHDNYFEPDDDWEDYV